MQLSFKQIEALFKLPTILGQDKLTPADIEEITKIVDNSKDITEVYISLTESSHIETLSEIISTVENLIEKNRKPFINSIDKIITPIENITSTELYIRLRDTDVINLDHNALTEYINDIDKLNEFEALLLFNITLIKYEENGNDGNCSNILLSISTKYPNIINLSEYAIPVEKSQLDYICSIKWNIDDMIKEYAIFLLRCIGSDLRHVRITSEYRTVIIGILYYIINTNISSKDISKKRTKEIKNDLTMILNMMANYLGLPDMRMFKRKFIIEDLI